MCRGDQPVAPTFLDSYNMKILCIGDIVGRPGREFYAKVLTSLKDELSIDFVVANGENASGGAGIMPKVADEIFAAGTDVITLGDHTWDKKDIFDYLKTSPRTIRPANFPEGAPGQGWCIAQAQNGVKVGVINLLGRVFMRYNVNCPFKEFDKIVEEIKKETPVIIVDMHAETTSEKVAFGHYADGRATIVFGTHTHIQTADETILPKETAYITDLGMSGPYDSVIGQNKEKIIQRFLTSLPHKFEVAADKVAISGVVVDVDESTGRARSITRIRRGQQ
jgi:2',3'-cyclic-nucleotide 2'-phosphodiesterase